LMFPKNSISRLKRQNNVLMAVLKTKHWIAEFQFSRKLKWTRKYC
jgi:hypothetical protein